MKKTGEILKLEEENLSIEKENLRIAKENAAIAQENEMLRRQIRLLSEKHGDGRSPANDGGQFATPEEERKPFDERRMRLKLEDRRRCHERHLLQEKRSLWT